MMGPRRTSRRPRVSYSLDLPSRFEQTAMQLALVFRMWGTVSLRGISFTQEVVGSYPISFILWQPPLPPAESRTCDRFGLNTSRVRQFVYAGTVSTVPNPSALRLTTGLPIVRHDPVRAPPTMTRAFSGDREIRRSWQRRRFASHLLASPSFSPLTHAPGTGRIPSCSRTGCDTGSG